MQVLKDDDAWGLVYQDLDEQPPGREDTLTVYRPFAFDAKGCQHEIGETCCVFGCLPPSDKGISNQWLANLTSQQVSQETT